MSVEELAKKLVSAIDNGDEEEVMTILAEENGKEAIMFDVDRVGPPFFMALMMANANVVKAMVDNGADINGDMTLYMTFAQGPNFEAFKVLIDAGADQAPLEKFGSNVPAKFVNYMQEKRTNNKFVTKEQYDTLKRQHQALEARVAELEQIVRSFQK